MYIYAHTQLCLFILKKIKNPESNEIDQTGDSKQYSYNCAK